MPAGCRALPPPRATASGCRLRLPPAAAAPGRSQAADQRQLSCEPAEAAPSADGSPRCETAMAAALLQARHGRKPVWLLGCTDKERAADMARS